VKQQTLKLDQREVPTKAPRYNVIVIVRDDNGTTVMQSSCNAQSLGAADIEGAARVAGYLARIDYEKRNPLTETCTNPRCIDAACRHHYNNPR
jgi:hypothetical protein